MSKLIKQSKMLIDVLKRNKGARNIEFERSNDKTNSISFLLDTTFTSNILKSIFSYWGLDHKEWIKEWNVRVWEREAEIQDTTIRINVLRVIIFIKKDIDPADCNHNFVEVKGWSIPRCKKCAYQKPNKDSKRKEVEGKE
ncbi:MAG: hypothetical protein ACOC44_12345 [Promethearchaeia archaeon]